MSRKSNRRRKVGEQGIVPSPASYRARVQTIKVGSATCMRSLAEVLADPPKFPTLVIPNENGEVAGKPRKTKVAAAS